MTSRYSFLLLVVAGISAVLLYLENSKTRIAFIDIGKIYSEFKLTKELEAKFESTEKARTAVLDSMTFTLNALSKQIESDPKNESLQQQFMTIREEFLHRDEQFAREQQEQNKNYTEQVFKQINQYITDFRKEKEYDIILGGTGNGTVMSVDDAYNVSEEALEYINQKYSGAK